MLTRSMKSFVGFDSYWDFGELASSLPYIKITTGVMVAGFLILHALSGYLGVGNIGCHDVIRSFGALLVGRQYLFASCYVPQRQLISSTSDSRQPLLKPPKEV